MVPCQKAASSLAKRLQTPVSDDVPSEIEEGLFLGSIGAAKNKEKLRSLNITHVLTIVSSPKPAHPRDFVYKVISAIDKIYVNIAQHFDECFNFIDDARRLGGAVLVHCRFGKSRSVTVTIAYLMKKHGMGYLEAAKFVRERRPIASPNPGFIQQLLEFEKSLQGAEKLEAPTKANSWMV